MKNAPNQRVLDAKAMLDDKVLKKMIDDALLLQAMAESDSALRHVPDANYYKVKKRLRKTLEKLPNDVFEALSKAVMDTNEGHSITALLTQKNLADQLLKIRHAKD